MIACAMLLVGAARLKKRAPREGRGYKVATKTYVHGRIEGEVNSPEGRKKLEEQVKVLEEVGRVLEQRGYRAEKGEESGNETLGTKVVKKSWTK